MMKCKVYVVVVSWVSDGESDYEIHGVYKTREEALSTESEIRDNYSEDYGPSYWDQNGLEFSVRQTCLMETV